MRRCTPNDETLRPFQALALNASDNTATLIVEGRAGDAIVAADGEERIPLTLAEDIPFAHKVALCDIRAGDPILKYGEVMGRATTNIAKGAHVHVQNVESLRGRGDDAAVENAEAKEAEDYSTVRNDALVLGKPRLRVEGRTFMGYPREDGSVGTRNLVGIIATVVCANDVVSALSQLSGAASFTHQQGCSQTKPDVSRVETVLINLAKNPNLGAVVYVSLGCESVNARRVAEEAAKTGKPVHLLCIQEIGGKSKTIEAVRALTEKLVKEIEAERVPVPLSKLRLGLKCGSSDTTQGISSNIVIGAVTDALAGAGASVVIGETTEFMGAEHIAARHAANPEVARAIVKAVADMEARAIAVGVDMRGGQPTRGNIAGGLSTIEEKSLGALAKAGSAVFREVVDYGDRAEKPGLTMMDSPGREPELLAGLAAAGCSIVAFATGRGAPQGFPFMPVLKITGNEKTWEHMAEHMDCFVGEVISGRQTLDEAAEDVFEQLVDAASGRLTKAEECGYFGAMNIYTRGPTI